MNYITLFDLIFMIIFILHLFACSWSFLHFVEVLIKNSDKTWMTRVIDVNLATW